LLGTLKALVSGKERLFALAEERGLLVPRIVHFS
jgi:hypothetical protein